MYGVIHCMHVKHGTVKRRHRSWLLRLML